MLERIPSRVQVGEEAYLDYSLFYVTRDEQIPEVVAWIDTLQAVGLDLETDALPKVRKAPNPFTTPVATLQVGYPFGPDPRAYVICVRSVSRKALQPLLARLGSRKLMKLGMNIGFECEFFQHTFQTPLRNVACIQVAELLLRAGLLSSEQFRGGDDVEGAGRAAYRATSMASLTSRYLNIKIDKDRALRMSFYSTPPGQLNERQLAYAAEDTLLPFYVAKFQKKELLERVLTEVLAVEFATIPVLADATLSGMSIDQVAWRGLWQEATARRAAAEAKLDDLFRGFTQQDDLFPGARPMFTGGKPLNYDSPAHVRWALRMYCERTNWPIKVVSEPKKIRGLQQEYGQSWMDFVNGQMDKKKSPQRRKTVDDVPLHLIPEDKYCILKSADKNVLTLAKIRKQLPADVVDLLLEYSQQGQRADAFGVEFLNKHVVEETGRIHPQFHQLLASTGRISTQPNSQNIPTDPRYRACFRPKRGKKFVIADYSQIEPRLSAEVSQDPVYVDTFLANDDIYCKVAEAMTGDYPDKKTEQGKIMRQVFKTIVLALAYRMGPWKLRDRLTLALEKEILAGKVRLPTFEWAKDLHGTFLATCSRLHDYQNRCSDAANPRRPKARRVYDRFVKDVVTYVEAPCGRKRFFPPDTLRFYTEGPNAPIQGCSATITKYAAALVQGEIDVRGWDAHVIDLVHDEIVWEVAEEIAEEFAAMAKRLMEAAGARWLHSVPCVAEFPKGTNGVVDCWLKEAA